jgi:lipopolysaccharide assembly protein A
MHGEDRILIKEESTMRWFHLAVIIVFAAVTAMFAMQNFQMVTVSFLRLSAQMPLAFLVAIIYLLGAVTGGSLFALLRRAMEGARRRTLVASS